MGIAGPLSAGQLSLFNSQGYLVVESFASSEEIHGMRKRMDQLIHDLDGSSASFFWSTKNQPKEMLEYLYESAEKISFFFEENASDGEGNLKQPKEVSLSKIGHALHELDPVFRDYSRSEKISSVLQSLGYKRPVIMQSVYIFKQPGIGSEVAPHQDNSGLYTEPETTCTGLWLALEDATPINACMWAIPGSHRNGLARRLIRGEKGLHFDQPSPSYDQSDFTAIEVKAGSLVLIHGDLMHRSFENQSPNSRHAFSVHVVDTVGCKWAPENWIRRRADPEPLYSS